VFREFEEAQKMFIGSENILISSQYLHKYNNYFMLHTVYTFLQFIQLSQKVAPKS